MEAGRPWKGFIKASGEKPKLDKNVLKQVWQYAKSYRDGIVGSLIAILLGSVLRLITPLFLRQIIDRAIPEADLTLLIWLLIGLLITPVVGGFLQVIERNFSARVGEGIIYDLRMALFEHFQRILCGSLRIHHLVR